METSLCTWSFLDAGSLHLMKRRSAHSIIIFIVAIALPLVSWPEPAFAQRDVWFQHFEAFEQLMKERRYSEAHEAGKKSIEIAEQTFEADGEFLVMALGAVALQYWKRGIYFEAEPLVERIVAIAENVWGKSSSDYAIFLEALGIVYAKNGKYTQGRRLMIEALHIQQSALGEEDPDIHANLYNLGVVCQWQNRYAEAVDFFLHALRIKEKNLGPRHPDLINTLEGLQDAYKQLGKSDEADKLEARIREMRSGTQDHPTPQQE